MGSTSSFRVQPVAPVGTRTGPAFVSRASGCSYEDVTTPVYPASPRGEEFHRVRVAACVSLREAADVLGVSAAEVSGLEWGRYVFADDRDWWRAYDAVRARAGSGTPRT